MYSLSRSSQLLLKKKGVCGPQVPDPTPSNWCRWQQAGQGLRDSTARPKALQEPDKNPVSSEIRRETVHATQPCCSESSDLGPGFAWWSVKREAFASTKGFWRSRIQSAQAMHQHSRQFFTARGHVSPPLRAVESIRVSDDKSLGGNVRKWGFLQMKVFLAHSLFTADGRSGGRNPAEGDLSAMSKKTHQCLVRERCTTVITTRWKDERKPV